ncbi:MAG TPA: hypothetical protein VM686_24190 [Polyangiaceae bacterium]|nr:hypothetical protein [Polyangiaceae bacterium]
MRTPLRFSLLLLASTLLGACGAHSGGDAEFPPGAKRWYERGVQSYRAGDLDDAEVAVDNALRAAGNHQDVKLLAARVSLARLDYDRTQELLTGVTGSDARGLRGRALWYKGDVQGAADELESLLADPDVRDGWAMEIVKLARRGQGRKPFAMSGGLLAVTEMVRAGTASLIVPVELNGDPALALIATGTAEAVVDASNGSEPAWVSLRFGERVEVRDVPALAKDLSGVSKQVNAPIKILLGVNLLRHIRPTIDFAGSQFVVRSFEPPPPPMATTLKLAYVRGGGMLVRGAFGAGDSAAPASLLVDTALPFPMALDSAGFKKAGIDPGKLMPVPNAPAPMKSGILPSLRLGAFDVPQVPGLHSDASVKEREDGLGIELDGLIGSGLLATFRMTLVDGGRSLWLEDIPAEALVPPKVRLEELELSDVDLPLEEEEEEPAPPPKKGVPKAPAKGKKP